MEIERLKEEYLEARRELRGALVTQEEGETLRELKRNFLEAREAYEDARDGLDEEN